MATDEEVAALQVRVAQLEEQVALQQRVADLESVMAELANDPRIGRRMSRANPRVARIVERAGNPEPGV